MSSPTGGFLWIPSQHTWTGCCSRQSQELNNAPPEILPDTGPPGPAAWLGAAQTVQVDTGEFPEPVLLFQLHWALIDGLPHGRLSVRAGTHCQVPLTGYCSDYTRTTQTTLPPYTTELNRTQPYQDLPDCIYNTGITVQIVNRHHVTIAHFWW